MAAVKEGKDDSYNLLGITYEKTNVYRK